MKQIQTIKAINEENNPNTVLSYHVIFKTNIYVFLKKEFY